MKELLRKQGIDFSRLSQAVILESGTEESREQAAMLLACAAQCTAEQIPCGECSGCRKTLSGNHPDVTRVEPLKGRVTVSVTQAREVRSDAYVKPNEGRSRVFWFPQADALTEEAQNALLKVIEEPPAATLFLFGTPNAGALLETIRSRCVTLSLTAEIGQESGGEQVSAAVCSFCEQLLAGSEAGMILALIRLEKDRLKLQQAAQLLELALRDAVALRGGQSAVTSLSQTAEALSAAYPKEKLIRMALAARECAGYLQANGKGALASSRLIGDLKNLVSE